MRRPREEILHLLKRSPLPVLAAVLLVSCANAPSSSSNLRPVPSQATAGLSIPLKLSGDPPPYSRVARREGIEGRVVVRLDVDANGDVTKITVVKSSHDLLKEDLPSTFRRWKFRPPDKDGKPVAFTVQYDIDFRMAHSIPRVLDPD
jgi:protein TonB